MKRLSFLLCLVLSGCGSESTPQAYPNPQSIENKDVTESKGVENTKVENTKPAVTSSPSTGSTGPSQTIKHAEIGTGTGVTSSGRGMTTEENPSVNPIRTTNFLSSSDSHTLEVYNGKVYSWGNDGLWLGRKGKNSVPKTETAYSNMNFVATSEKQSFAVNTDGELLVWPLFDSLRRLSISYPTVHAKTSHLKIASVALGPDFSAVITTGGDLYTWGKGQYGKLGHLYDSDWKQLSVRELEDIFYTGEMDRDKPTCVQYLKNKDIKVASVELGAHHAAAVSTDGRLFTWGDGRNGKLGHGNNQSQPVPKEVEYFTKIKKADGRIVSAVSLGAEMAAAVISDGGLYIWGTQFETPPEGGHERPVKKWMTPQFISYFGNNVASVTLKGRFAAVITNDRKLYTRSWTADFHGLLGRSKSKQDESGWGLVEFPDKAIRIEAISIGSDYVIARSEDGRIYAWGKGSDRLGLGPDVVDIDTPRQLTRE